jgi:hypothetical protein
MTIPAAATTTDTHHDRVLAQQSAASPAPTAEYVHRAYGARGIDVVTACGVLLPMGPERRNDCARGGIESDVTCAACLSHPVGTLFGGGK